MNIQKYAGNLALNNLDNFKINKYFNNPISFRGNSPKDTVELSLKQTSLPVSETSLSRLEKEKDEVISEIDADIAENNSSISKLEEQISRREEIIAMIEDNEFSSQLEEDLGTYLSDYSKKSKLNSSVDELISSYSRKHSVEIDSSVNDWIKSLLEFRYFSGNLKQYLLMEYEYYEKKVTTTILKLREKNDFLENQKQNYLKQFETEPVSACYYDPYMSLQKKAKRLEATGLYKKIDSCDFSDGIIEALCKGGIINPSFVKVDSRKLDGILLFDLRDEKNKKSIDYISNNADGLRTFTELRCGIPFSVFQNLPIKKLCFEYSKGHTNKQCIIVNINDEQTVKCIEAESEKWKRTKPVRSKYYFQSDKPCSEKEIPAAYLASLGFGNVTVLRKLVSSGMLKGRIELVETKDGTKYKTMIDSSDIRLCNVLRTLKSKNNTVISYKELAKELGITQKRLLTDIAEGKIDIIPEYMLAFDDEYKYIDKKLEKNKEYIETTLFEQEITKKLKQEQREQHREEVRQRKIQNKDALSKFNSLRMSLVWHFCPNTRSIGSQLAENDGYLCSLLAKEAEDEESLSRNEQIKVDSYRKEMWLRAGTDELKEGFIQASNVLKQVKENGLDSIEDEEVRKIFQEYGFIS